MTATRSSADPLICQLFAIDDKLNAKTVARLTVYASAQTINWPY
ncbi:MAG: hypothetical protein ACI90U_002658 [Pseudomonadales bacterium]|jgi:hypothetical protein